MTPTLAPPLPRELQIEITGACNLRCHMCLVRYQPALDRRRASMSFERFKAIVDGAPGLDRVVLQGLGEPLMAPDVFAMIRYASARGIEVGFNTNATLLTRRAAEELVEGGLGWLRISLDGATAATYEAIREGARFDRVVRNVAGLLEVMAERGARRPELGVVFVAMRRNIAELPALVRLVAGWGIRTLRVQNLSHSFSDTDPAGAYREIREYAAAQALWSAGRGGGAPARVETEAAFAEARRQADALGVVLRLPAVDEPVRPREPGTPGCDWPWRAAYVRWDGQVQPCCMLMGADRGLLGDAARGLERVWTGPEYRAFRAALLEELPPEVCRGCSMYRGVF